MRPLMYVNVFLDGKDKSANTRTTIATLFLGAINHSVSVSMWEVDQRAIVSLDGSAPTARSEIGCAMASLLMTRTCVTHAVIARTRTFVNARIGLLVLNAMRVSLGGVK